MKRQELNTDSASPVDSKKLVEENLSVTQSYPAPFIEFLEARMSVLSVMLPSLASRYIGECMT